MRRVGPLLSGFTLFLALGCAPALFVSQPLDADLFPEPRRDTLTFWGHASIYVDAGGVGIVTDPVFESSYSPLHGRTIPLPPPSAYDQTSIILISHAHVDHLDPRTLARFAPSAVILCPEPSEPHVQGLGPVVRVMRPGDEHPFRGGRVTAVPALHPGGRWLGEAKADGRALGYIIQTPGRTIYYSGDTELFAGMKAIGERYRPDLAVLNVNAHLKPRDALRASRILGAARVLAIHVGSFGGRSGRLGSKWHREFLALAGSRAVPLEVGASVALANLPGRPDEAPERRLAGPPEPGARVAFSPAR